MSSKELDKPDNDSAFAADQNRASAPQGHGGRHEGIDEDAKPGGLKYALGGALIVGVILATVFWMLSAEDIETGAVGDVETTVIE